MKTESLISKVKRFYENIEVEKTSKGIKFSLPFKAFIIYDISSEKMYNFPEGHLAITYDTKRKRLGYPFVEEKYSHPCLSKFDAKKQIIPLDPHFHEEKIKNLKTRDKIVATFQMAKKVLTSYATSCEYAWHHISSKEFKKYILS